VETFYEDQTASVSQADVVKERLMYVAMMSKAKEAKHDLIDIPDTPEKKI
jgi:hypothetical protein